MADAKKAVKVDEWDGGRWRWRLVRRGNGALVLERAGEPDELGCERWELVMSPGTPTVAAEQIFTLFSTRLVALANECGVLKAQLADANGKLADLVWSKGVPKDDPRASRDPFDEVCARCGWRNGSHGSPDDRCPLNAEGVFYDDREMRFVPSGRFVAVYGEHGEDVAEEAPADANVVVVKASEEKLPDDEHCQHCGRRRGQHRAGGVAWCPVSTPADGEMIFSKADSFLGSGRWRGTP